MKKPLLFIDVDGVLFGTYNNFFQLRPNIICFLNWCTKKFDCVWLTCWDKDSLDKLGTSIYADRTFQSIDYCHWIQYDDNKAKGALSYAKGRKFFWIEDSLPEDELELLDEQGIKDDYIYVKDYGEKELEIVQKKLQQKLGAYKSNYANEGDK